MEQILTSSLLTSLTDGDFAGFFKFLAIFILIWLQIKGVKKELKNLSKSINESLDKGEKRFETIEQKQQKFEDKLNVFENPIGGVPV